MWGDGAWGETAWGEPQDNTIPPFQDRRVFAVIDLVVAGAGAQLDPGVGSVSFGLVGSAVGQAIRPKVKVIETNPKGGRGKTGLSHTGLN